MEDKMWNRYKTNSASPQMYCSSNAPEVHGWQAATSGGHSGA